ncbi:hypothetical protein MSAN_01213500 [Mycena sanguinolenta]|uniref:Uncharacterized protein n=1 Tax=Mycena sanguinolenta TaxID=230812 RepID=A0A8H6YIU6_9AGAR|nr:hypothetical protein MSAN_01213500 [Mycena sanguinolenta]
MVEVLELRHATEIQYYLGPAVLNSNPPCMERSGRVKLKKLVHGSPVHLMLVLCSAHLAGFGSGASQLAYRCVLGRANRCKASPWRRVKAQAVHGIVQRTLSMKTAQNNQQILSTSAMSNASTLAHDSPNLPTQPSPVREHVVAGVADTSAPEQPAATSPPHDVPGIDAAPTVLPAAPGGAAQPASHSGNAGQGATPAPATNASGSTAGSAPRRSLLDGLSAEEQARRRAAIGRSGAGGAGRASTGTSGPVANSRGLSKPERKARREAFEADLLELAATHEVTVKTMLGKYPEKGEANIRKFLTHASALKSSRQLTIHNAMLHDLCLKSKEESSTGKGKSSIQITQELGAETIREMITNLDEHEHVELLEQLGEYRASQRHGVRKSNKAQAADLDALFMRTGTRAMMFAVRSDTHDPNEPTFIETGGSRGFLKDYFDKSYQEIGHNYEMWSVAKGRGESKSNSMVAVRSEINKEVHAKLRIVTGKKDAKMSWSNYEADICEAHKVKLVGWLVTQTDEDGNVAIKMGPLNQLPAEIARQTLKGLKNGTIFFVEMSKAEHTALVAKHDALRAANGPLKKRAQRSDFGKTHASRKHKASEDDEEDDDKEEEDEQPRERGNERRPAQKKRRTSQDTPAIASNALTAGNAPNAPNAVHPPTAANASHPPTAANASHPPTAANASPPPTAANAGTAPGAPKKRAPKGQGKKTGPTGASTSARPTPRPWKRRAIPTAAAPATDTPVADAPTPTLHLPFPDPPRAMNASTAAPSASLFGFDSSTEALAFGALGPDSWGLPQDESTPGVAFDPDLMRLLADAVSGAWDNGATQSAQPASGSAPQHIALPPSVRGSPLVPLNSYTPLTRSTPTPTDGLTVKHVHNNIGEMWGENAPPSAAGATPTAFSSTPSPAPYLITQFRL